MPNAIAKTLQTKAHNPFFVVVVGPEGSLRDTVARRIYEHMAWVAPVEYNAHFLDQAEVDPDNAKQFVEVVNSYLDWHCDAVVVAVSDTLNLKQFVQVPHHVIHMTAVKPKQTVPV